MDWLHSDVFPAIIEEQKAAVKNPTPFHISCWEDGYPYEGAIGGGLTYQFTPNSIGMTTSVVYSTATNKYKLDLTDYDSW